MDIQIKMISASRFNITNIFGLGEDNKVYLWDKGTQTWELYSDKK